MRRPVNRQVGPPTDRTIAARTGRLEEETRSGVARSCRERAGAPGPTLRHDQGHPLGPAGLFPVFVVRRGDQAAARTVLDLPDPAVPGAVRDDPGHVHDPGRPRPAHAARRKPRLGGGARVAGRRRRRTGLLRLQASSARRRLRARLLRAADRHRAGAVHAGREDRPPPLGGCHRRLHRRARHGPAGLRGAEARPPRRARNGLQRGRHPHHHATSARHRDRLHHGDGGDAGAFRHQPAGRALRLGDAGPARARASSRRRG